MTYADCNPIHYFRGFRQRLSIKPLSLPRRGVPRPPLNFLGGQGIWAGSAPSPMRGLSRHKHPTEIRFTLKFLVPAPRVHTIQKGASHGSQPLGFLGAPRGIRTPDTRIRSLACKRPNLLFFLTIFLKTIAVCEPCSREEGVHFMRVSAMPETRVVADLVPAFSNICSEHENPIIAGAYVA
jgi:hypothetical protein